MHGTDTFKSAATLKALHHSLDNFWTEEKVEHLAKPETLSRIDVTARGAMSSLNDALKALDSLWDALYERANVVTAKKITFGAFVNYYYHWIAQLASHLADQPEAPLTKKLKTYLDAEAACRENSRIAECLRLASPPGEASPKDSGKRPAKRTKTTSTTPRHQASGERRERKRKQPPSKRKSTTAAVSSSVSGGAAATNDAPSLPIFDICKAVQNGTACGIFDLGSTLETPQAAAVSDAMKPQEDATVAASGVTNATLFQDIVIERGAGPLPLPPLVPAKGDFGFPI